MAVATVLARVSRTEKEAEAGDSAVWVVDQDYNVPL